jgi:hypothetical protein
LVRYGRAADRDTLGNRLVRHAGIGRQQDLCALELASGLLAAAQHRLELGALGLAQLNPVAYVHLGLPHERPS